MSITNLPLTYSKAELLVELNAKREIAKATDAERLAEHQKAEKAHLAEFKRACREAAKWDYETAKKKHFSLPMWQNEDERPEWAGRYSRNSGPTCPRSEVSYLNSLIAMVEKLSQDRFTISSSGKWRDLYQVLTADVPQIKGLC